LNASPADQGITPPMSGVLEYTVYLVFRDTGLSTAISLHRLEPCVSIASKHHGVIYKEFAVLFDEEHFGNELTRRFGKPLFPDDGGSPRAFEYSDWLAGEKYPFSC
jgi:hypothetical protein